MTTISTPETGRRLRSALFVDFDNVYLGLRRLDPDAAEAFAGSPGHWLTAMEDGSDADGPFTRRFLVRACYLNPSAFSQFRPNFTRAGFTVVDCPSLTQQGKSSADINLVLDAVDALAAETRYDEFVIVSADADFTPLAQRFRRADRRVTIVTAGPAASAYRAVADTVITGDQLAEMSQPPAVAEVAGANGGPPASTEVAVATAAPPAASVPAVAAPPSRAATRSDVTAVAPARRTRTAPTPAVDLPPLQRQVVAVTDIPNLPTERYEILLTALAQDVASTAFDRPVTARRVRDACQAQGAAIGRPSVNTVVNGILYAGLDLTTKPPLKKIAETWANHAVGLCQGARMELTPQDVAAIRVWVSGGTLKR